MTFCPPTCLASWVVVPLLLGSASSCFSFSVFSCWLVCSHLWSQYVFLLCTYTSNKYLDLSMILICGSGSTDVCVDIWLGNLYSVEAWCFASCDLLDMISQPCFSSPGAVVLHFTVSQEGVILLHHPRRVSGWALQMGMIKGKLSGRKSRFIKWVHTGVHWTNMWLGQRLDLRPVYHLNRGRWSVEKRPGEGDALQGVRLPQWGSFIKVMSMYVISKCCFLSFLCTQKAILADPCLWNDPVPRTEMGTLLQTEISVDL